MERRVTSAVITYLKYTRHRLACVRAGVLFRKAGFCCAALAHTDVLLRSLGWSAQQWIWTNYSILIKQDFKFKCETFADFEVETLISTGDSLDCGIFNCHFKTFKNKNHFCYVFEDSILGFYQKKKKNESSLILHTRPLSQHLVLF